MRSAFAAALFLSSAFGQSLTLNPDSLGWQVPPQWLQVQSLRLRYSGTEGQWYGPVLGAYTADNGEESSSAVPEWFRKPTPTLTGDYTLWPDSSPQNQSVLVPASVFSFFLSLNLTQTTPTGSPANSVQDWCAPLLDNRPTRNWNSQPPVWLDPTLGNDPTPFYSIIWTGMLRDVAEDEVQSYDAFRTEAMMRYCGLVQCLLAGLPESTANAYFDSPAWKVALEQSQLRLRIQAQTFVSGIAIPPPAGNNDATAPPLTNHPGVPANCGVVGGIGIRILLTAPANDDVLGFNGELTPGQTYYFLAVNMSPPINVEFPIAGGMTTVVQASSASTRTAPVRYKVVVPPNLVAGTVRLATGLHPNFFVVGSVTPSGN